MNEYILVIKHGALGDFIIATCAFSAIRDYHPYAHIVLLTTEPYRDLAEQSGYFNEVWVDSRPKLWKIKSVSRVLHMLRGGDDNYRFKRVYDLQSSDRTAWYYRLMGWSKPQWVGKAKGCSHPRLIPDNQLHVYDIFSDHLKRIGFPGVPLPNVDWLDDSIEQFNLPERFIILIPGASAKRPKKRWTVEGYAALIKHYSAKGFSSVVIGGMAEKEFAASIETMCLDDEMINLVGKTSFGMIAALARKALGAVGSDTGPMHIVAAAGCPAFVLFSGDSDPKLHGPRSEKWTFVQVDDLNTLNSERVISKSDEFFTF